jgi:hypothetical protein
MNFQRLRKMSYLVVSLASTLFAFAGGNGTARNPYQIATAGQLDNVCNYLGNQNSGICFILMNDIDLGPYFSSNNPGGILVADR